jgi:hypothetical protein
MVARISPGPRGEISPIVGDIQRLANSRVPESISKDFERLMVTPRVSIIWR